MRISDWSSDVCSSDLKLVGGGLIDLEFLIHVTQFTHDAGFAPRLDEALADLVALGLLPPELIKAHELLTRYLVVSRLAAPGAQEPTSEERRVGEEWVSTCKSRWSP